MTSRAVPNAETTLLSPTVTGVAMEATAPAVTNAYWEGLTPAAVCDSFFESSDENRLHSHDASPEFWASCEFK